MVAAAEGIKECYRVLDKAGLNIVGEVLAGQDTFYEMDHFPEGDVYDHDFHSQYYYHAHREDNKEHGHFHTFIRSDGIGSEVLPASGYVKSEPWPEGQDRLAHLVAISMNSAGYPISLLTTNRWVTDETWFNARDVIGLLPQFRIDHASPSWPVNIWITNMLIVFRLQIELLLEERDQQVRLNSVTGTHDILEDRKLEITSRVDIDFDDWLQQLESSTQKPKTHFPMKKTMTNS